MKLWQKVFLCTFILFEVLFNASSFYLIEHHFNSSLRSETERGLSEEQLLTSQIKTDWSYISALDGQLQLGGSAGDFLKNNGGKYTRFFSGGQVSLEILDDRGGTVYGDFTGVVAGVRSELENLQDGSRRYILRDIGKKTYLFVAESLALGDASFRLSYIRDISGVYSDKASQIGLFFKINAAITVILAGGLYLLIWFLTRSIRSLNASARTIAGGDYTQRVPVLSGDEIGVLARSFNQMADAVESKVDELEETAKNRQLFINYLTHELKTPLTSIIGYADFLRTARFDEEVFYKSLSYIYSEGKRLESLSFKLMDLVLMGNKKPEMAYADMAALIAGFEESMRPQLEQKQLTLCVEAEPHTMLLERDLIKLLCTNLLDNAVKASGPGGRITLRGHLDDGGRYTLEVQDEGIGIPEEDVKKILEPFFVVDKARSKANHGAGLGLAICAEIVKLHQGSIHITSQLNKGTTVAVTFPGLYN